jgi:ATP-dependent Clp protease adaptor protein ClpS
LATVLSSLYYDGKGPFSPPFHQGVGAMSDEPSTPPIALPRPKTREETRTRRLPPYNVILENDDYHSMEFVVEVLQKVLGQNLQRATLMMMEAHTSGRAIVWTGPKEVAELKAEQIHTMTEVRKGRDLGPLSCVIEPAPGA